MQNPRHTFQQESYGYYDNKNKKDNLKKKYCCIRPEEASK